MNSSDLVIVHRDAIHQVVAAHRARNPRVFGSVLHAEDTETSDLDLLIGPLSPPRFSTSAPSATSCTICLASRLTSLPRRHCRKMACSRAG